MEGAEEKKTKVPTVPETLRKKRKNFAELLDRAPEKEVCPKDDSKGKEEAYLWKS